MNQRLVVLGAGESGVGAALLGQQLGYTVFVSDAGSVSQKYAEQLDKHHIGWESAQHSLDRILEADIVVKSPGIPSHVPIVVAIKDKGIEMVSEIEFASRHTSGTIVGITGTNGKTTTAMLAHHVLSYAGKSVKLAGNVGLSFAKAVANENPDYWVLELSSFQLEDIRDFHPHIAVMTNLSPDHLDRYENNYERYVDAKFNMLHKQTSEDYFLYDAHDKDIQKGLLRNTPKSKCIPFSESTIHDKNLKPIDMITIDNASLRGTHNAKNAMAAAAIAQLVNIRKETIRESLQTFQGASHRLEHVLQILKVDYINDSKATNVNAAYYALESMNRPTVWIVGGVDKGNDYSALMPLVRQKVKAIICLGLDNEKLIDVFSPAVNLMVEASNMKEAVQAAYHLTEKGDAVLLSPACASFDLFDNYEDRGNQFKEEVRQL